MSTTTTRTTTRPSDSTASGVLTNSTTTTDPVRLTSGATTQAYVLPIPGGWGVVTYGDPIVPDDEVLPLPCTDRMPYWQVVERFLATPAGQGATVDGWETLAELRACEPELAARVWGQSKARVHQTNAGSLRKGDVIAEGLAGYRVIHTTTDGTRRAVAASSVHSGEVAAFLFPIVRSVAVVHPEDVGQPLPDVPAHLAREVVDR